jgi:NADH dehydrogenase
MSSESVAKVFFVGSGFAGLAAAKALAHAPAEVTLIDRRNHHVFQPVLYQLATTSVRHPDRRTQAPWIWH